MTDQLRSDCVGVYGNQDILTPQIDRLAEDGVVYKNSFCPAPICTPSRYSFLTGVYPHQHFGRTNHSTIPAGLETFPQILREAGYGTSAVGKMHLTPTYLDVGFESMTLAEQNGPGRYEDDYHRYLQQHGLVDRIDLLDQEDEYRSEAPEEYWQSFGAMESNLSEEHYSTSWIGERALDVLQEWEGDGNLLMASFIKPHHPFDPPRPWSRMYDPNGLTVLPGWTEEPLPQDKENMQGYFSNTSLNEASLRRVMAYYYATISQIDHYVGKMISLLIEKEMYEDTFIMFTSDHGEFLGFHHLLLKGGYMYDPVVRVPLIIKFPGNHRKGTRHDALVSGLDVAPTIIAQAGCERGRLMDGVDLASPVGGRDLVFAEMPLGDQYMVRSRTHKLLLNKDRKTSLFFDLGEDPLEIVNRFGDPNYQSIVREYTDRLTEMIMFESPQPSYLNYAAPTIGADNVPISLKNLRGDLSSWFREKMR